MSHSSRRKHAQWVAANPNLRGAVGGGGGTSNAPYPEGQPAAFRADLPLPPDPGAEVELGAGNHTLASNTRYRLIANAGTLTVPTGSARLRIDGAGFSVVTFSLPPQSGGSPPGVTDLEIRNIVITGPPTGDVYALNLFGTRVLLEDVSAPTASLGGGILSNSLRHATLINLQIDTIDTIDTGVGCRIVVNDHVAILGGHIYSGYQAMRIHGRPELGGSRFVTMYGVDMGSAIAIGHPDATGIGPDDLEDTWIDGCVIRANPPGLEGFDSNVLSFAPAEFQRRLTFINNHLIRGLANPNLGLNQYAGLVAEAAIADGWVVQNNTTSIEEAPPETHNLLLEDGDELLLEDGDNILLESAP